jgi:hypothetical protein
MLLGGGCVPKKRDGERRRKKRQERQNKIRTLAAEEPMAAKDANCPNHPEALTIPEAGTTRFFCAECGDFFTLNG